MRGESVPIGNEVQALEFVLQPDPVLEDAVIVTEMQCTRRPHAGENAITEHACRLLSCAGWSCAVRESSVPEHFIRPGSRLDAKRRQTTLAVAQYHRGIRGQVHHGRRDDPARAAVEYEI